MESPNISKRKKNDVGDSSLPKLNYTPKNQKISVKSEEFCLYKLHRESSPNFRAGQEVLEVGWGDSPEPLKVEQKFEQENSFTCKKLDTKESPKSSIPCKRRNIRSTFSLPSKSIVDVAKYVAEVQELSKNIMKEFNAKVEDTNLSKDECATPSSKNIENVNCRLSSSIDNSLKNIDSRSSSCENKDPAFDSVLQTFINEEDDWLSQALSSQEMVKTPHKSFVKSKSENELTLPVSMAEEKKSLTQTPRINNNFRRSSSFDLTKPNISHKNNNNNNNNNSSVSNLNGSSNQYSLQEIERKRLEAKYRRERREIERKKLEALKKLEMKKLRAIKT